MSRSTIIPFAAVILVILGGAYYYWYMPKESTPEPVVSGEDATVPATTDTSDAGLEATASALDALIGGMSTDEANVSASISDVQVTQTY